MRCLQFLKRFFGPSRPTRTTRNAPPPAAARPVGLRACSCWLGELAWRARGRLQSSKTSKRIACAMFFGYPGAYSMGVHVCVNMGARRGAPSNTARILGYAKRAVRAAHLALRLGCAASRNAAGDERGASTISSQTLTHAITRRRLRVQLLAATYSEKSRPSHTKPPSLQWPRRNTRSENNSRSSCC